MILSGDNILSLSEQTGISYSIDLSLNNVTGFCDLGFSGDSKFNFKLKNGKVFDNENFLVYSYSPNEKFNISGNINTDGYDYYVNNYYYSNKNKNFTKFNSFYLNANNVDADLDLIINGDKPSYELTFNNLFYIYQNITGKIKNNSNLKFRIYSGEVVYPITFSLQTIPPFSTEITNAYQNIIIQPDVENAKNLFLNKSGEFLFNLYTNFGKITGSFITTGEYVKSGVIKSFDFEENYGTSLIETGKEIFTEYTLNINFGLEDETGYYPFNKDLEIEFIYKSGYTGILYKDLDISTGITKNLTGFISGSGYLSDTVTATGSGINLLNDQIVTGLITNNISGFTYLNGFVINDVNILGSGIKKYTEINSIAKIIPTDIQTNYRFGSEVSLNAFGNIALVGSPGANGKGASYIFTGIGSNWTQAAKITGNDIVANDNFGIQGSLNIDGNVALISAFTKTVNGFQNAGAAYIFTGSGGNWTQAAKITANDAETNDFFGGGLAINTQNNILFIGASSEDPNGVNGAGSVYIFTGSGSNWAQAIKITGNDAAPGDSFGSNIALNSAGNIAFIGALNVNLGPISDAGAVYIFTGSGNNWAQAAKITGSNPINNGNFGNSISVNSAGNIAFIGAYRESPLTINQAGAVYVFTGNGNSWGQAARIIANDAAASDLFGNSISLNSAGNIALIGSQYNSPNGINDGGAAYLFTGNTNNWVQIAKITGSPENIISYFGRSVSLNSNGNIGFVGASLEDPNGINDGGAVHIFDIVNERLLYTGVTGRISGFSEEGILPYDDNIINIIDNTSYTGYLSSIIATGITNLTENFLLTGKTTINYQKTFTGTFNLITGYTSIDISGNLTPTGFVDFRNFHNFNNRYYSINNLPADRDLITLILNKRKFYDDYVLSGKLNITGKRSDYNLTTGISIPVKFGDVQWP